MKRTRVSSLAPLAVACLAAVAGCVSEQPVRKPAPKPAPAHPAQDRRPRRVATPGPVGTLEGSTFFVELQKDRPEATERRPVLVEEDAKRRTVGHAYLSAPVVLGLVDEDVVVVAGKTQLVCYDTRRHELRWELALEKEIDDFLRKGDRLEVSIEGGTTLSLDLATGRRSVP